MIDKHSEFLGYVKRYVADNPDAAPYVTNFVAKGLEEHLQELRCAKSDIEAALIYAVAKKTKGADDFIRGKIEAAQKYLSFNWETLLPKESK